MSELDEAIAEYFKKFPKSGFIPFGFSPSDPPINTEKELIEAYKRCVRENKTWDKLFRDVSDKKVIY